MKKLLIVFIFVSLYHTGIAQTAKRYGPEYNGYQLATDSLDHFCVANIYGTIISPLDSIMIHTDEIMISISNSTMSDRLLIVRILEQQVEPGKTRELLNMTTTYNEIAVFVLKDVEKSLLKKYSEKELAELKEKH